ncbi:uncharacterized protein RJT21DRAFT_111645 [Scheffersomyces amazonensis]|uniref:uncharacterized protein n=1 Tax=Scheffersomyces amazonensis TaxID=1078765 RepID=UPI00315DA4D6
MATLVTELIIRANGGGSLPTLTGMPTLTTSTSQTFTTPSVSVPPSHNNPYIIRNNNPTGTVFIAVGAIVGAIFIGFILYHLIISLVASRIAKKGFSNEKEYYEKYQNNNTNAYGGYAGSVITPQMSLNVFSNHHVDPTISKIPLISPSKSLLFGNQSYSASQVGDNSTIYNSETGPTSKHDLTKMFISPTAEVMSHKRNRSGQFGGSTTNSIYGGNGTHSGSVPNLINNPGSRLSQVPNLYVNNEFNNSDYSLSVYPPVQQQPQGTPQSHQTSHHGSVSSFASPQAGPRSTRKTVPSMYLEDLIDDQQE